MSEKKGSEKDDLSFDSDETDVSNIDVFVHAPDEATSPLKVVKKLSFERLDDSGSEKSSISPPSSPNIDVLKLQRNFIRSPLSRFRVLAASSPNTAMDLELCQGLASLSRPRLDLRINGVYSERRVKRIAEANVNPYTQKCTTAVKRPRCSYNPIEYQSNGSSTHDFEDEKPAKRLALQDCNIARYNTEFIEQRQIGKGEFSTVFKCLNRLDGCQYAIKKSRKPIYGRLNEKSALNEVYAHAVLGSHNNIVRYYSAWTEDGHMFIQSEYCNGGSLEDLCIQNAEKGKVFSQRELSHLLLDVAEGLRYIHALHLVHLDIKPANIFVTRTRYVTDIFSNSLDDGFVEEEEDRPEKIVYKIGDLGHVTSVDNPTVEEGDSRYLCREVLLEDYSYLTRADIFSLGLTVYAAGGGEPLEKNGPQWHHIRDGHLNNLPQCTEEFNNLLKLMIHPDPSVRPSALTLLKSPVLRPLMRDLAFHQLL